MPEVPFVPDVPEVPVVPDVPEVPVVPEVPDVPVVPDVPEEPLDPSVPLVPEVPEKPDVPLVPDEPLVPADAADVPDVPGGPDVPLVPEVPAPPVPDVPSIMFTFTASSIELSRVTSTLPVKFIPLVFVFTKVSSLYISVIVKSSRKSVTAMLKEAIPISLGSNSRSIILSLNKGISSFIRG